MKEVWLDVLGYEGFYEASNSGLIRNTKTLRVLAPGCIPGSKRDYPHVTLCRGGQRQTVKVAVAVLSAFCGPPPFIGAQSAHNDGDKMNSRLTNLRWATRVENQADVNRHGRRNQGEDVFGSKLTPSKVRAIRKRLDAGERYGPVAKRFGVSVSAIFHIKHRKTWKHVP